ncbi:MAG: SMP-30/gluconolactonase/LRE family protein [Deltaproteobacteria bacterium]|nr:SMP-30/gluconolactonase/LRE family protein [Deltaproteobacteria bacterium]
MTIFMRSQMNALWLSARGDSDPSDTNLAEWERGDVVQFGPGATFDENTTSGSFANLFEFFGDGGSEARIQALHYVSSTLILGQGAETFTVRPGDVIGTVESDITLESNNSVDVAKEDVFLFRPDVVGNYTSGTFYVLLQNPTGDRINAITLVEKDVAVGETMLPAGTFLLAYDGSPSDVFTYRAIDIELGTQTNGAMTALLRGGGLGFGSTIQGLELVEEATKIGDTLLSPGQLLLTVDASVMVAGRQVDAQDIIVLDIATTELGIGTVAKGRILFDGDDVGLDSTSESLDALTLAPSLIPNAAPIADADAGVPYVINEGDALVLDGSFSSDPDGGVLTYEWDLDNDGIYGEPGEATGINPTVTWATLQSHGVDDDGSHTVGLRVTDAGGRSSTTTADVTVVNTAPSLSVSGATSVVEGATYTLNLAAADPGNDTITEWTINWGDGSIETLSGNPSSATHVYSNPGHTNNIIVTAMDEDGTYTTSDLLVASNETDRLYRFDALDGSVEDVFGDSGSLQRPLDIEVGPDGLIYATGFVSNDIRRYDPTTGAFLDLFVGPGGNGLDGANRIAWGPDGHLYVTSSSSNQVLRYDGTTGVFIDAFVPSSGSPLVSPDGILFAADGNLYIASSGDGSILRYDGTTGTYLGVFADTGPGGFVDLAQGPDGHIYASNYTLNSVQRFDGLTGASLGIFVAPGSGGLSGAGGIAFGPGGALYVTGLTANHILRYDGSDGSFLGTVVAPQPGLVEPWSVTFSAAHQVTVTPEPNTAPAGADTTVSTLEDTPYVFDVLDFGFTDPGDGNALLEIIVDNISGGTLRNGAITLADGATVSAGDILAGDLSFQPAQDAYGSGAGSFSFQVRDDGGTIYFGIDVDATPNVVTVDVTPVNDAPDGADVTVSTNEDTDYVFGLADFPIISDLEGDQLDAIVIGAFSGSGSLTNGGAAVGIGSAVTRNDLVTGQLRYTPAPEANGAGLATFSFQVRDDGGVANLGTDLDSTPNVVTVDVAPVNDAPDGADVTVSTNEDTDYVFGLVDFPIISDVEGDQLDAIVIGAFSGNGSLTNGGAAVGIGSVVTRNDLVTGQLRYTPAPEANGTGLATFAFQVRDDGGVANLGTDLDSTPNVVTVDVAPVNDAPDGADVTVSTNEDTDYVFGLADFPIISDVEGDQLDAIVIGAFSGSGSLTNGGTAVGIGSVVTRNDLATAQLRFIPTPNANGAGLAAFSFQVRDDGGVASLGANLDPTPNRVTIDVARIPDAPLLAPASPSLPTITEDDTNDPGQLVSDLIGSSITLRDTTDAPGIAITGLASGNGTWQFSTDGGSSWSTMGTASNSSALLLRAVDRIRFVPDASNATTASLQFKAWDQSTGSQGLRADTLPGGGASAFSSAANTASITVTGLNDSPSVSDVVLEVDSPGRTIASLFAGQTSDVDLGSSLEGVAVVGNGAGVATQGRWQYSTDAGQSWFDIGSVGDDASALVLARSTLVRFAPAFGFAGSPAALIVRAIDDSYAGAASSTGGSTETRVTIDAAVHGGTSALSASTGAISTGVHQVIGLPEDPIADPEPDPLPDPDPSGTESEPEPPNAVDPGAPTSPIGDAIAAIDQHPLGGSDRAAWVPLAAPQDRSLDLALLEGRETDRDDSDMAMVSDVESLGAWLYASEGSPLMDLMAAAERGDFVRELDRLVDDVQNSADIEVMLAGSTLLVTAGLSVGYAMWLTRGGLLLASLITSMPAWRLIDPIPILMSLRGQDDRDEQDAESLHSMVEPEADLDETETDSG